MAGTTSTAALRVTMDGRSVNQEMEKWQKEIGAVRDGTERLFDSQGRWIDGVTKAQQKIGVHRDAMGRLLNANDQLVEGLKNWEIQAGYTVREMGDVYDAAGKLIRQGAERVAMLAKEEEAQKKLADAIEREMARAMGVEIDLYERRQAEAEKAAAARDRAIESEMEMALRAYERQEAVRQAAAKKARDDEQKNAALRVRSQEQVANSLRAMGAPLMQVSTQLAVLGGVEQKTISQTTAMVGAFMSTLGAAQTMVKGIQGITAATQGATAATVLFNAVSGNWVAIAAGLAAAGGVAYMFTQVGSEADAAAAKVSKVTDEIKRLNEIAKEKGKPLWDMSDYSQYSEEKSASGFEKANLEMEKQKRLFDELREKNKAYENYRLASVEMSSSSLSQMTNEADGRLNLLKKTGADILRINKGIQESQKMMVELGVGALLQAESAGLNNFEKDRKQLESQIQAIEELARIDTSYRKRADAAITAVRQQIEKSHRAEYEASDGFKQEQQEYEDVLKYRADTMKMAADREAANVTEEEKRHKQLQEEITRYTKALEDETLSARSLERIRKAQAEAMREQEMGTAVYGMQKEVQDAIRKEQEQQRRLEAARFLQGLGGTDSSRYAEKYAEEQKKILGDSAKYFDKTGKEISDYAEAYRKAGEELLKRAGQANKTPADTQMALRNLQDEMLKKASSDHKATSAVGVGAASYQSVEAYQTIAAAKDPTASAVDSMKETLKATFEAVGNEITQAISDNTVESTP